MPWLGAVLLAGLSVAAPLGADEPPFAVGERITFRIRYLHVLAGRAWLRTEPAGPDGALRRFVEEARSQGFFAWLFHFRVDDRTVAEWDPATQSSLGIEKHLREGKSTRDQMVRIDPAARMATLDDPKIATHRFEVEPRVLDILSALYVARLRGVTETEPLYLPVFDNGKRYRLGVRFLGRQILDLPLPLGRRPTIVVEPQLLEGTGLFVKEGRLKIWLTEDGRRIPVRMEARVPLGAIAADLESYESGRVP
ncbi:MAG: DUF3108 domain-containing protein [Vicinamibacteria bacterium]